MMVLSSSEEAKGIFSFMVILKTELAIIGLDLDKL